MTRHHPNCDVLNAANERDTIIALHLPEDLPNPEDYSCLSGCQPEVAYVTGTITFDNGETVNFDLNPNYHTRDGNTLEYLGYAVDPCEAMYAALRDNDHFTEGED